MRNVWRYARGIFARPKTRVVRELRDDKRRIVVLLSSLYHQTALLDPKYADPARLTRFGFRVFSQHDEDGIVEEILQRIGVRSRAFVEIGAGNGVENNTRYLLVQGWTGLWIESSQPCVQDILARHGNLVREGKLVVRRAFVTAESIEAVLASANAHSEPDVLSIDIDGNDYWIWKSITRLKPRVVVIEYNATFGPRSVYVLRYDPAWVWDETSRFGASLKALETLATEKGYVLVGCDFAGVNAFFVRADLAGDHFARPYSAEHHWEPPRYFMSGFGGHSPEW